MLQTSYDKFSNLYQTYYTLNKSRQRKYQFINQGQADTVVNSFILVIMVLDLFYFGVILYTAHTRLPASNPSLDPHQIQINDLCAAIDSISSFSICSNRRNENNSSPSILELNVLEQVVKYNLTMVL